MRRASRRSRANMMMHYSSWKQRVRFCRRCTSPHLSLMASLAGSIRRKSKWRSIYVVASASPNSNEPNHAIERTANRRTLHFLYDFHTFTSSDARSCPPSLILFSLDVDASSLRPRLEQGVERKVSKTNCRLREAASASAEFRRNPGRLIYGHVTLSALPARRVQLHIIGRLAGRRRQPDVRALRI